MDELRDQIAMEEFKMTYNQLGVNEKIWVDDEINNNIW